MSSAQDPPGDKLASLVAELQAAADAGEIDELGLAKRLDEAIACERITARQAFDLLLPGGSKARCTPGTMSDAQAERADVLLLAICERDGFAATFQAIPADLAENASRPTRCDPDAPMRWAGGRCRMRLIKHTGDPVDLEYVAWCVPGSRGFAVCGDFVDPGDVVAMEGILRAALAKYRGAKAAPTGGLVTDDALLLALAERATGDEYPVVNEKSPAFHVHAIDMRAQLAFDLRNPMWWTQPSAASARFISAAAHLLRAAPWQLTDRFQVTIESEAWPFTVIFMPADPSVRFADGREAIFGILGQAGAKAVGALPGENLLVVAMPEEREVTAADAARLRAVLSEQGWRDRARWPYLIVCRDGEVGRPPTDVDFDLAFVVTESLARACAEVAKARHGRIERVYCLEQVDTTVKATAVWWTDEEDEERGRSS